MSVETSTTKASTAATSLTPSKKIQNQSIFSNINTNLNSINSANSGTNFKQSQEQMKSPHSIEKHSTKQQNIFSSNLNSKEKRLLSNATANLTLNDEFKPVNIKMIFTMNMFECQKS